MKTRTLALLLLALSLGNLSRAQDNMADPTPTPAEPYVVPVDTAPRHGHESAYLEDANNTWGYSKKSTVMNPNASAKGRVGNKPDKSSSGTSGSNGSTNSTGY